MKGPSVIIMSIIISCLVAVGSRLIYTKRNLPDDSLLVGCALVMIGAMLFVVQILISKDSKRQQSDKV
jgi:lipid-A-disaccharide synthase-like uncharacterized protein